jgi:hypothetical protein
MKRPACIFIFFILAGTFLYAEDEGLSSKLYMITRIDFCLNVPDIPYESDYGGGFYITRARFGYRQRLSESVATQLEIDANSILRNLPYKDLCLLAFFQWNITDDLKLSGGKMYELFSPYYTGSVFTGAGIMYTIDTLSLGFQAGNTPEKDLVLMPALIIYPCPGDMYCELNLNGRIEPLETTTHIDTSLYCAIAGMELSLDFLANDIINEPLMTFFGYINYRFGSIKPEIALELEDISRAMTVHLGASVYFYITDRIFIQPMFDLFDMTGEVTWTATLRCEFRAQREW